MATRELRSIGYFDCPGGGQVVVNGTTAYVAHMKAPHGTTIVDVSDPMKPRQIAELTIPAAVHSHKVRVVGDVMLVNWEAAPRTQLGAGNAPASASGTSASRTSRARSRSGNRKASTVSPSTAATRTSRRTSKGIAATSC